MLIKLLSCLTLLTLLAASATAQTGRIAHLSHSGSAATLGKAVEADNFGLPPNKHEAVVDSLMCLNDSVALSYARHRSVSRWAGDAELKKVPWRSDSRQLQYYSGAYHPQRWEEAVQELRRQYPQAKLLKFEKQAKKQGRKKSTSQSQAFPKRPFQYSFWRGLAGVAGLGAVGWLLGRQRAA